MASKSDGLRLLDAICAEKSNVIRKFQMVKTFGPFLQSRGIEPKQMSAEEIETAIRSALK